MTRVKLTKITYSDSLYDSVVSMVCNNYYLNRLRNNEVEKSGKFKQTYSHKTTFDTEVYAEV